jgi:hypothetical protein
MGNPESPYVDPTSMVILIPAWQADLEGVHGPDDAMRKTIR